MISSVLYHLGNYKSFRALSQKSRAETYIYIFYYLTLPNKKCNFAFSYKKTIYSFVNIFKWSFYLTIGSNSFLDISIFILQATIHGEFIPCLGSWSVVKNISSLLFNKYFWLESFQDTWCFYLLSLFEVKLRLATFFDQWHMNRREVYYF